MNASSSMIDDNPENVEKNASVYSGASYRHDQMRMHTSKAHLGIILLPNGRSLVLAKLAEEAPS